MPRRRRRKRSSEGRSWEDALRECARRHKHAGRDGHCDWCGDVLGPRRRRWCSNACTKDFMESHVWSQARAKALRLSGHACKKCGSKDRVSVHHIQPVRGDRSPSCLHHQENLRPLCHLHHMEAHHGKK